MDILERRESLEFAIVILENSDSSSVPTTRTNVNLVANNQDLIIYTLILTHVQPSQTYLKQFHFHRMTRNPPRHSIQRIPTPPPRGWNTKPVDEKLHTPSKARHASRTPVSVPTNISSPKLNRQLSAWRASERVEPRGGERDSLLEGEAARRKGTFACPERFMAPLFSTELD